MSTNAKPIADVAMSLVYCFNVVDEFDIVGGKFSKSIKLPRDSGPVSKVLSLPNGKNLLCASQDNLRQYDLFSANEPDPPANVVAPSNGIDLNSFFNDMAVPTFTSETGKPNKKKIILQDSDLQNVVMPFSIIPGHHGGVISDLSCYI